MAQILDFSLLAAYQSKTVVAAGGVTYDGYAQPGVLTSAAGWAISKTTTDAAGSTTLWADGNHLLDNKMDDCAILAYS